MSWTVIGNRIMLESENQGIITPVSLIQMTKYNFPLEPVKTCPEAMDKPDKNVIMFLLTIYRAIRTSNADGRDKILTGMGNQLEKTTKSAPIIEIYKQKAGGYISWQHDKEKKNSDRKTM